MNDPNQRSERRRLISHNHRKRSVTTWIMPLIVIIAIIVLLPKVVALFTN